MTQPTKIEELNKFALELNKSDWNIVVPAEPSSYLMAYKEGVFIYIQYERLGGPFSFSTVNKPSKENGTGARACEGELNIDNFNKAINFFNNYRGYKRDYPVQHYTSLEDYFKRELNNILGNHIFKF